MSYFRDPVWLSDLLREHRLRSKFPYLLESFVRAANKNGRIITPSEIEDIHHSIGTQYRSGSAETSIRRLTCCDKSNNFFIYNAQSGNYYLNGKYLDALYALYFGSRTSPRK